MKHLSFLTLLTLATPMWATTSAPSNIWHANFSTGSMPKEITVSRESQNVPVKGYYKHGYTENGWTVDQFGYDYCAICPTSTGVESPVNAMLRTPVFTIPAEGAVLTWTARSVLPGMAESYEVWINDPTANTPALLTYEVEAEASDRFVTHSMDLSSLAGQEVCVIFNCRSVDKYMLAIGGIAVGNSDGYCVEALNTTPRFAKNAVPAGGVFNITGQLLNTGTRPIPAGTVIRAVARGEEIGSFTVPGPIGAAENLDFAFAADPSDNATTEYTVEFVPAEGDAVTLFSSDVTRSYFARRHFIDEGTGVWCNNCPQGALDIDALVQEYPGQMIPVCTHINDIFGNDAYWPNLKFYAVPYFMLDRNHDTAYSDTRKFDGHINVPTIADLSMKECEVAANGQQATVKMDVTLAEDLDNASGRYGIGYVMTADYYVPDGDKSFMQQNMSTRATALQYYYLPTVIPAHLSFYRHVSISSDYAFEPVPGTLPEYVKAYEPEEVTLSLPCPDLAESMYDVTLVAFVLDSATGSILNAVSYHIGDRIDDNVGTGTMTLDCESTDVSPEYYTLQGMRISRPAPGQMVIERRGSSARKIIIR